MFQHKDGEEIKKVLNKDFENVCDWFVGNELFISVKIRPIWFSLQVNVKSKIIKKHNIKYQGIEIK